jgi:hypothetical protein
MYISLQIFMYILFLELILFRRISSLALIWGFAHFMYIRDIYTFYLQLNQLRKNPGLTGEIYFANYRFCSRAPAIRCR